LGDNWTTVAMFPGDTRMYGSGFSIFTKGYITCGTFINLYPLNDLWEYNHQSNTWAQKTSMPGAARSNATSFSMNFKGYIFGGTDGTSEFNDLWEYDQATNSWMQKASLPAIGRTDAVAFTIGNNAYVVGGWYNISTALSEVWQYNSIMDNWTRLPDFPGIPAPGGAAFTINGLGYVVGGYGSTECWEYNPVAAGMKEEGSKSFVIGPNPFEKTISVFAQGKLPAVDEILVMDIAGKEVYRLSNPHFSEWNETILDLGGLNQGFYFVSITSGKEIKPTLYKICKLAE